MNLLKKNLDKMILNVVPDGCRMVGRFQARHSITFRQVCCEAKSVDMTNVHLWHSDVLMDIIDEFKPADIYNAD